MPDISHYQQITAYITRDGSLIRELMHPAVQGNQNQSLAEATIPVGVETLLHKHLLTEEIYHITQGEGWMTLGEHRFAVAAGDTICIEPNTAHKLRNTGQHELKLLCCCSPAYSHHDTILLEAS